jgi:hypothetical protein
VCKSSYKIRTREYVFRRSMSFGLAVTWHGGWDRDLFNSELRMNNTHISFIWRRYNDSVPSCNCTLGDEYE